MTILSRSRSAGLAFLALAAALALVAGCSRKITQTDAGYTQVEGKLSAASRLVVWPDTPVRIFTLDMNNTPGTTPPLTDDDFVISTEDRYVTGAGSVQSELFDATPATGYQFFRREGDGGFRQVRDFTVMPARAWRDSISASDWEMYSLADPYPSSYRPASYVGRGMLGGVATTESPLTNLARVTAASIAAIDYSDDRQPTDSLFRMTWTPVSGAAGYWLHVFQYRASAGRDEKIRAGSPSPVLGGNVRDFLVAYVPGTSNSYRLGDASGAEVLMRQVTIFGQVYQVRVSAVDPNGQLIGFSYGDTAIAPGATSYQKYAQGSFVISPTRPSR